MQPYTVLEEPGISCPKRTHQREAEFCACVFSGGSNPISSCRAQALIRHAVAEGTGSLRRRQVPQPCSSLLSHLGGLVPEDVRVEADELRRHVPKQPQTKLTALSRFAGLGANSFPSVQPVLGAPYEGKTSRFRVSRISRLRDCFRRREEIGESVCLSNRIVEIQSVSEESIFLAFTNLL